MRKHPHRTKFSIAVSAATALSALAARSASADDSLAPGAIVISQVYGGGGNAGASYTHDFVELFNRGTQAVDVSGWSVQYASAAGSSWNVTALSGIIQPGQYYLVRQGMGTGGTTPLPTPDATGNANMSATSGKVALSNASAAFTVACPTAGVVDLVGFGSSASCFEGAAPTANLSNTLAAQRFGEGCVDTAHNAADFAASAPTPRNGTATFHLCQDVVPEPEPEPTTCAQPPLVSPISQVQGAGQATPCAGERVVVEGVVVGDYEGTSAQGALRGFYVQSRDEDRDGDPLTSEGIFVFNFDNDRVELGDLVRVTGVVAEFQGQTQIGSPESLEVLATGRTVTPSDVTLPFASSDHLERYEGMLVRFPQPLFVTEFFQLGRFGQIVVSSNARLAQPTSVAAPGAAANALQATNDLNRLIVDDNLNNQNPDPILFGRAGNALSALNTLRGGDVLRDAVGVLTYGWAGNSASPNAYRLRVVGDLSDSGLVAGGVVPTFEAVNERPSQPPVVNGSLVVASFNVLNYFLTLDAGGTPCGPNGFKQACRGANSAQELTRQRSKLIEALIELNADVLGLMELENTPDVAPVVDLVSGLNARLGANTYAYVDTGVFGTDTIRTGLIYKTATVSTAGSTAILGANVDPRFDDTLNRPALAQSFVERASGATFTVVVNHLKSKGSCPSSGPNIDLADGQSCWSAARTAAARALVDWLSTHPTGIDDDDFLIVGDLNSYAHEDPIQVFLTAGYENLVERFEGPQAYGYVFDGQWGYLDHALASASLFDQVTGAASYHINADEPSVLDYNVEFKTPAQITSLFAAHEFRTSDHDPIRVGLSLEPVTVPCTSVLRGRHTGALRVSSGITCLEGAQVTGPITLAAGAHLRSVDARISGPISVGAGASLNLEGTQLTGALTSTGASEVRVCDSKITGPISLTGTTNVSLGDPSHDCPPNQITGQASITGSTARSVIAGNRIVGALACTANTPAPVNLGLANTVVGSKSGQCRGL